MDDVTKCTTLQQVLEMLEVAGPEETQEYLNEWAERMASAGLEPSALGSEVAKDMLKTPLGLAIQSARFQQELASPGTVALNVFAMVMHMSETAAGREALDAMYAKLSEWTPATMVHLARAILAGKRQALHDAKMMRLAAKALLEHADQAEEQGYAEDLSDIINEALNAQGGCGCGHCGEDDDA